MGNTLQIIIVSLIAGLSTALGAYLVYKHEAWAKKNMVFLISLTTGILLASAFFDLLPEALELNESSLIYAFIAILALYILEQRIIIHSCHDEHCEAHHAHGTISIVGLSLHSLIDGIIIGASFSVSTSLGIIASIGIIMHEIPEGISIYSILTHKGYAVKKKFFYAFLVAVATPLGAIASILFLKDTPSSTLGIWLALAAGAIIYIGASDLIPETHKKVHKYNAVFVILGALLIYLLTITFHH